MASRDTTVASRAACQHLRACNCRWLRPRPYVPDSARGVPGHLAMQKMARLGREALAYARLAHPAIVRLYQRGAATRFMDLLVRVHGSDRALRFLRRFFE